MVHFATDLNAVAVGAARRTGAANGVPRLEVVRGDLAEALAARLAGHVDVLVFNPPYVPTPSDEVGSDGIEAAWAGGADGREVIDRLLPRVGALLRRPRGRFYMVLVEENRPADVAKILATQGLSASCVVKKRARNEHLAIYRYEFAQ